MRIWWFRVNGRLLSSRLTEQSAASELARLAQHYDLAVIKVSVEVLP
jgi:hypothetical protein